MAEQRAPGGAGPAAGPLERATARLMAVPRALIGALILASIAINFANVVGRYLFLSPIVWAEEVMIFIMVWCVFLGAVPVTWEGRHLRMDLVAVAIPSPFREAINALAAAAFIAVAGLVVVQSWEAVTLFARLGQVSNTARVPMVVPHLALLVGFALMLVAVAVRFRAYVAGTLGSEAEDAARDAGADAPTAPGGR